MYIVGLTTFTLCHCRATGLFSPLAAYCLFRRGNKNRSKWPIYFPEESLHLPPTNKLFFFFFYYYYQNSPPIFAHQKRWEPPRPRVPKYLRFPITLKEKSKKIKYMQKIASLIRRKRRNSFTIFFFTFISPTFVLVEQESKEKMQKSATTLQRDFASSQTVCACYYCKCLSFSVTSCLQTFSPSFRFFQRSVKKMSLRGSRHDLNKPNRLKRQTE